MQNQVQLQKYWEWLQRTWRSQAKHRSQALTTIAATLALAGFLLVTVAVERQLGPPILSLLIILQVARSWRSFAALGGLLIWSSWLLAAAYQVTALQTLMMLSFVTLINELVSRGSRSSLWRSCLLASLGALAVVGDQHHTWWWLIAWLLVLGYRGLLKIRWPRLRLSWRK